MKRMIWPGIVLALLVSSCAGKKEYPMSEMPPAPFLAEPRGQVPEVVFDAAACDRLGPITGDAFQALEVLVAAGHRRTGSQAYRCAAAAAKEAFAARGWETRFQTYRFPYYEVKEGNFSLTRLSDGQSFPCFPVMYSLPTTDLPAGRLRATVVSQDQPVKGRIVYLKLPLFSRGLKETVRKLKEKGAVGFVVEADLSPVYSKGLPYPLLAHPAGWHYGPLPGVVAAAAKELLGQEVELINHSRIVPGRGWNVIAQTPGDYQDYVLITAHLDSWFSGALDDGSGSAVVLELARLLSPAPAGATGMILLLADSEEIGLVGSAAFAREFGTGRIKAVIELDMVSRKNDYSGRSPAQARPLPRLITTVPGMKPIARNAFADWEADYHLVPARLSRLINGGGFGSDIEWFYFAGVPGLMIWTPSRYYHTVKDDLEYMDARDLEQTAEASARLAQALMAQPLPRQVPNYLDFDFRAKLNPDGKLGLQVQLPPKTKRAEVTVKVFYENGLEKPKLKLKPDAGGIWQGEYSPLFAGDYQLLAVVSAGKKFGKKWLTLPVPAAASASGTETPAPAGR